MTAPAQLSTKDIATALDIDAKALRVFLRAAGEGMSSRDGKSYVFSKANLTAIKKAYPAWVKDRETTRPAKAAAKAAEAVTADDDVTTDEDVAEAS